MKCLNLEYDVVLSFAGEDRKYVEETAESLVNLGVKVFYDIYEDTKLWGKDLYQHLDDVYQNKAKYAVVFISKSYSRKLWTNHELKSAQARAFEEAHEYILPARFDETEIPGIRKTVGYIDLRRLTSRELADKIIRKLGEIEPKEFLPENLSYMRGAIKAIFPKLTDAEIDELVSHVFIILTKTKERERSLLTVLILNACLHDITKDFHEDISLFERMSTFTREEILEILKGLFNLGFEFRIKKKKQGSEKHGNAMTYEHLSVTLVSRRPDLALENLTAILVTMYLGATKGMCNECSSKTLNRLDFTGLKDPIEQEEVEDFYEPFSEGKVAD